MEAASLVTQLLPQAVELRRQLHRIPELAFSETKTAAAIRAQLKRLGIDRTAGVPAAPTATIAHIGDLSKPCVALRADIDALPIAEKTGLPYASEHPGCMHACGHDGHTATLLLAAAVLARLQGQLPVCVKLIFQPAEESGGGAKRLADAGVLDGRIGPRVSAVFAMHVWANRPLGQIYTRPGPLKAASDNFSITFTGKGAHAATPHAGHDPIVAVAHAILSLQQIASREVNPVEPCVITVGRMNAGTADNIIPNTATISGTVRTLSEETRSLCRQSIERRCAGIASANNCTSDFAWKPGYPLLVNNPAMYDYVERIARQTLAPADIAGGADPFVRQPSATMGAEDFAYFAQQVPACMFHVGLRPASCPDGAVAGIHHELFNFNDGALSAGARMFVALVLNFASATVDKPLR